MDPPPHLYEEVLLITGHIRQRYPCRDSKYYGRLVAAVLQCCVLQGDGGARECGGCGAPAAAAEYKTGRAEAAAISFPATMRTLVAALCLGENYLDICIDRYI